MLMKVFDKLLHIQHNVILSALPTHALHPSNRAYKRHYQGIQSNSFHNNNETNYHTCNAGFIVYPSLGAISMSVAIPTRTFE
jgi:hypothetical protein